MKYVINHLDEEILINRLRLECKAAIRLDDLTIEIVDDEDLEGNTNYKVLPTIEELYPYNEALRDFFAEKEIMVPENCSASKYLWTQGHIHEFNDWHAEAAVLRLYVRLSEEGIVLITVPEQEGFAEFEADDSYLNECYRLEKLFPCSANKQAIDDALEFVESDSGNSFEVTGESGNGKHHIAMAILHMLKDKNPNIKVRVEGGEDFVEAFSRCSRERRTAFIHERCQGLWYVKHIEEVYLAGGEVVDILNAILQFRLENHKKTIWTATHKLISLSVPEHIKELLEKHVVTTSMEFPDYDERKSIVEMCIADGGFYDYFSEETIEDICTKSENMRELIGYTLAVAVKAKLSKADEELLNVLAGIKGFAYTITS